MKNTDESIQFFDLSIFSNDIDRLLTIITPETKEKSAKKTQLVAIFTPNPEQVVLAQDNPTFKQYLQQADIRIPDGIGLIIAQKVLKRFGRSKGVFAERITGVQLSLELLKLSQERGWKTLILGGREYTKSPSKGFRVQKVDTEYLEEYTEEKTNHSGTLADSRTSEVNKPTSKPVSESASKHVIYWLEGYADIKKPTHQEEELVQATLKTLQPEVVFVALGAPHQETWVIKNTESLEQHNVKIALVVGGSFDVILGKLKRAPHIVRQLGFEWLFRLFQEPHRWKRQLKLITFVKLVFQKLVN